MSYVYYVFPLCEFFYICLFQHETSRANWTSENTHIFCDIYCMQLDLGQCVRGSMSKWGWKDVALRYYAATGLVHDNEQFSSRVRQLRAMWHFINDLRTKFTGLGRRNDGSILAPDSWWEDKCGVSASALPFTYSPCSNYNCNSYADWYNAETSGVEEAQGWVA